MKKAITFDGQLLTLDTVKTLAYNVTVFDWDTWDLTTYDDTSWQSTLVKDSSDNGTVTISTASQFINFGNTVISFYANNSLSSLTANIVKHLKFNDATSLTTVQDVYSSITSTGVKANASNYGLILVEAENTNLTLNGNGHVLSGLYCYSTANANAGSFIRAGSAGGNITLKDFTFDKCVFRSNAQASAGFSMISGGTVFTTSFVNFNKCAISSESTSSYQALAFGFLNNNTNTTYTHVQTSFYKCGFRGSRAWSEYSCGDGGISNWSSSPRFNSVWTDCTYISPVKLGGNGTMMLLAGNRANLTLNGSNTYYNVGADITAQGVAVDSIESALLAFNSTSLVQSRPNFTLIKDDDNVYHVVEV